MNENEIKMDKSDVSGCETPQVLGDPTMKRDASARDIGAENNIDRGYGNINRGYGYNINSSQETTDMSNYEYSNKITLNRNTTSNNNVFHTIYNFFSFPVSLFEKIFGNNQDKTSVSLQSKAQDKSGDGVKSGEDFIEKDTSDKPVSEKVD